MRIAVVGAGISGLVAARELARSGEVWLFDRAPRAGGHACTVEVETPDAGRVALDIGFLVFNRRSYPVLTRLFSDLGVATAPSSMGFAVEDPGSGFVVSGESLGSLLARRRNLVDPRFWKIAAGQLRFARAGQRELARPSGRSLGEFARAASLPRAFVELDLSPMAGALWSMPPQRTLDFPAASLLRFFANHGLLTLRDRPAWRTVAGGSRRYVDALLAAFPGEVRLGVDLGGLRRTETGVELAIDGERARFDRVALAVHSDQALALHAEPTAAERQVLGAIGYRANETVLHDDPRAMPRRRRAWTSWNVRLAHPGEGIPITYWINRLQPLATRHDYFVTLNRSAEIDPARVLHRVVFAHPQFDAAAVAAPERWGEIDGGGGVHYAGAYWRHGFHEDGAWSGERAARALELSAARAAA